MKESGAKPFAGAISKAPLRKREGLKTASVTGVSYKHYGSYNVENTVYDNDYDEIQPTASGYLFNAVFNDND
jgi:hypothetical protein